MLYTDGYLLGYQRGERGTAALSLVELSHCGGDAVKLSALIRAGGKVLPQYTGGSYYEVVNGQLCACAIGCGAYEYYQHRRPTENELDAFVDIIVDMVIKSKWIKSQIIYAY